MSMIYLILGGIGALVLMGMARRPEAAAVRPVAAAPPTVAGVPPVPAQAVPQVGEEFAPIDIDIIGLQPQPSEYTMQENQNCAHAWLTQSCQAYQENKCSGAIFSRYTMTGDGTYYFEYSAFCSEEGGWGIPIPTMMRFTVVVRDCQILSHSYSQ